MTQHLTEKDVRGIATYARIGLTDEEVTAMTEDLNNIIESLKPITEYDLEGVEPRSIPLEVCRTLCVKTWRVQASRRKRHYPMHQNSKMAASLFLQFWAGVINSGSFICRNVSC